MDPSETDPVEPMPQNARKLLRDLSHLRRAALQVEAQDRQEEAAKRRAAVAKPTPMQRIHRAIVLAVQCRRFAKAEELFEKAPRRYQAVFHLTRFHMLAARPRVRR